MSLDQFSSHVEKSELSKEQALEAVFAETKKALNALMQSIVQGNEQHENTIRDIQQDTYIDGVGDKTGTGDKTGEHYDLSDDEAEKISVVQKFQGDVVNYNGAWAKNNNPTGITWPISKGLGDELEKAGVFFEKGTPRPKSEGGNYVKFETMGDGLQAYWIALSRGNQQIAPRLSSWVGGSQAHRQDYIKKVLSTAFGKDWQSFKAKTFADLNDAEKNILLMAQVRNESGGLYKLLQQHNLSVVDVINTKDKIRNLYQNTGDIPGGQTIQEAVAEKTPASAGVVEQPQNPAT